MKNGMQIQRDVTNTAGLRPTLIITSNAASGTQTPGSRGNDRGKELLSAERELAEARVRRHASEVKAVLRAVEQRTPCGSSRF